MIRWLRVAAMAVVVLAVIGLGSAIALFLVANGGFTPVHVHPWLQAAFDAVDYMPGGTSEWEVWLPALWAGWLIAVLALGMLLLCSMSYVWRRRQYETLIHRLERELARLRNLPITNPAPLQDLPEAPDPEAARILAAMEESRS